MYVSELQKTKAFYSLFFNQEPIKEKVDYLKYELNAPALVISFIENPKRVNMNFGHLGIQVESKEDLEDRIQNIKKAGLESLEEENTACCYAVQDKVWVRDPDGAQWEVYYFHKDVGFNDPRYEKIEEEATCCIPAKKKVNLTDIKAISCC